MSHLLLLLDHSENRRLLQRFIGDSHELAANLEEPFDLCIADARALGRFYPQVQALKAAATPLVLPLLFIASSQHQGAVPARVWKLADEVIVPPVEPSELSLRLENLLHTRQLSLNIELSRKELQRNFDELDRLRAELEQQNQQLKSLNEEKNQLMGAAAHDLRTPLGVIATYSDFLLAKDGESLGPEEREFIDKIRVSSSFMRDLVDDLLDTSHLAAGELELRPVPTDIAALVRRNAELNRLLSRQKGIELRCHIEAMPPLLADGRKIEQVLNNLIGNAVKFSSPGSTIEVSAELSEQITLSVKDQGPGIPADELHAVFDPFHRTSVESSDGEKGTGLGLAIVRRIVEGHGGQIRVESKVGEGSTFYVTLPAPKAPEANFQPPQPKVQGPAYDREAALERFGDPEILDQAADQFIAEYPALLDLARRSIERSEPSTLRRAAAKLSWHFGLLCAQEALETALALESAGRTQISVTTAELLVRLEQKIQHLQCDLKHKYST